MADTGAHTAGTYTLTGWSNGTNANASDDTYATGGGAGGFTTFEGTNFGFDADIAAPDTIDGVEMKVEWKRDSTLIIIDTSLRLMVGGSPSGANKASGGFIPSTEAITTLGGSTDTWSLSLTAAQVRASTFGVRIVFQEFGGSGIAYIDHMTIKVFYTTGASGNPHYYYAQQ